MGKADSALFEKGDTTKVHAALVEEGDTTNVHAALDTGDDITGGPHHRPPPRAAGRRPRCADGGCCRSP
ncbi:hypothetical protein [Kitasatospora cathayae]|uniref:Uncharacterized protein n=1 Tax=Kitasatospora cathayae TaxID=3004092 RepID=A0ABY7QCS7_9ACTN|nr:hypothetical protein [Kitasatospora sp. HUAS 3-15]WBP90568.1 hypothetical protein O1G21_35040 [Kitasatospora sp. HUAS 3-15]